MCARFDEWANEIQDYCVANGFDFDKARRLSKCWGKNDLILQYFDPECESVKKGLGLRDETPMPVVLVITRTASGLMFEQTENTRKYLS